METAGYDSGSPVTDVILSAGRDEAEKNKIRFDCSFRMPECDIDPFDMSVILNNALSNALEAASKCENAFVEIRSAVRKNAFVITVRNSGGAPLIRNGIPLTDKEDKSLHGFGFTNIKSTAEKYHGTADIEYSDGVFSLTVMLMMK